jgi:RHS repeat-associated protein
LEFENTTASSKFKFQGQEEIPELGWYDFGNRMYDSQRGQFTTIDALADHPNQVRFSPYTAFWNNPILYTDPDGNCPSCPQGEEAAKMYAQGATVNNKDGSWTWTGKEWQTNQTTQVSERTAASAMPVNMAFGMGAYAGLQQTGQFLSSLTTTQGWKDLGQGFINMARMGNPADLEGMMIRAEMAMEVDAYAENIPNMTAGEIAYDLGYGSEKVAEAVLTRRVMPVTKASLGLPKGFGKASKYTNMISYGLKGRMGQLPFNVRTPIVGLSAKSRDVGIILSRNLITPVGYGIGVGQLQYVQKRK